MRGLRLATLLVFCTLVAACGGGEEAEPGGTTAEREEAASRPPTDDELRWLGKYTAWGTKLSGALEDIGRMQTDDDTLALLAKRDEEATAALDERLEIVRSCTETFRDEVGTIPSERLRDAYRFTVRACEHFKRGADADARGIQGEGEEHFEEAAAEWEEATSLLGRAQTELAQAEPRDGRRLPTIDGPSEQSRIQPLFSRVAGDVVDKEIETEVRCWSEAHWRELLHDLELASNGEIDERTMGFTSIDRRRVNLAPWVCAALEVVAYGGEPPTSGRGLLDVSQAVVTLTHEAQHAAGTVNEAVAECYGMQRVRPAAAAVGADEEYAALLAETTWTVAYPQAPEIYRTPDCADGGKLDLDPDSSVWP